MSDGDPFRPTPEDRRVERELRRAATIPVRRRPGPAEADVPAAVVEAFGRPAGVAGSFADAARPVEPTRPPAWPAGRVVAPVLAEAFGRPAEAAADLAFAPPAGSRYQAGPVPESPWWKPDAPRDPWRDPGSPAHLAGPPDLDDRPVPAPPGEAGGESGEGGPVRRPGGLGAWLRQLSLSATLVLLLCAVLLSTAGGATGYLLAKRFGAESLLNPGATLTSVTPNVQRPPGSVADIARRVLPAVVSIEVHAADESGTGSGVVVDGKGYIITNNHVVSVVPGGKGSLRVVFADQTSVPAAVVGRDPKTDLAVLKVDRPGLVVATLGDSAALQVGDPVIAIGSPLGLASTVTAGIVSALNRPVPLVGQGTDTDAVINAIQTDAAINPGNSGGALVDGSGAVVGINSAIATLDPAGRSGSIGVGFAIPINEARDIAEQIIRTGSVRHASLGVNAKSVTQLNGSRDGALVEAIQSGGAAARAGLRDQDVITKVDNTMITGANKLVVTIRAHRVGDKVTITYVRGNRTQTAVATLRAD
ncbi:MAG TPA: trypsin-like peptidase domain-containing protein [Mycobacteriales bacterium]|nr:trypsin-like peptidase domain-containing protein [Mycobacteriales bacterium]